MKKRSVGLLGLVGCVVPGTLALALLIGCGNFGAGFFQNPNSPSSTTTSGDYVYAVDSNNFMSGFSVGSGALTAISGLPVALPTGLAAASIAVSRANTYVYVGGLGGIVCYSIGTGGALTQVSGGGATLASADFVSLTTSPDGQWLIALEGITNEIYVFGINPRTGLLTETGSPLALSAPTGTTPSAKEVAISPNGGLIAAAMGPAGDYVFPFNTSTGGITTNGYTAVPVAGYSDDAIAFDPTSGYLLIGRGITATGNSEVLSYSVSSIAVLGTTPNVYTSGQDPYALLVDLTGTYLYSANRGSGNISGYTISNGGILAALTDSPYASGSQVTALAEDNTKKYAIAAAAGGAVSSALTLYQFDALTAGQLDAVATYGNGTGVAGSVALAATH